MPEMRFIVIWPNGEEETCYSPSLVVNDFLAEGGRYPIAEFLVRTTDALTIASDRVQAKYGFPCSLAFHQLERIRARAQSFAGQPDATVLCQSFII
ncbi:MSMEG_0570 family nitrogen starvation response protein [Phyllobacterium sp. LjRoot231]|uniref:MSMEG_0570 family nitrogen starvation response protein n=1 Tax=Phyllobacterium sp. LjRoot231 TaxID=3342289 RepID=UPI003ED0A0B2